jgi:7-carboxy-7-deazaguanine synthase
MTLKLSELYTSVQGEGPNVGTLVQFVRFGGCNMRCPGWPCDTLYSVEPSFSSSWERVQADILAERICSTGVKHVVLTGGEPFLQHERDLHELSVHLKQNGYEIEVFTNGSFEFPKWALQNWWFIMDWKLQGSGEANTRAGIRHMNVNRLKSGDAIKFVVKGEQDLEEARLLTQLFQKNEVKAELFVGAAWGHIDDIALIDYIKNHQLPWRLNVQVHKHIWAPDLRGV